MRIFLAAAVSLSLPLLAHAGSIHGRDRMISFDDQGAGPRDCGDLRVEFGHKKATVEEERMEIPPGDVLNVRVQERGGIYVQQGSGGGYTARLCKAAAEPALLTSIHPVLEGRSLSVEGPADGDRWVAYLIIDAPTGASMKVESDNAPITLKRVRGSFVARAENGPISIEDASGTIEARTTNGPIALSGGEGDVQLHAQNGPLAIELDREWRGKGLVGRTQNGPLALSVGSGFRSGIVVESQGHSPWVCDGPSCDGWKMDGKVFTLGGTPALVRLSTENGPVAIASPEQ